MASNSGEESGPGPDGELLCLICCEEEQIANVFFVPCSHKACAACVQKMRVANIYKVRDASAFCLLRAVRISPMRVASWNSCRPTKECGVLSAANR